MEENIDVIEVELPLEGQFAIHATGLEIDTMSRDELVDFAKTTHTTLVAERYLTRIMFESDPVLILRNIEDSCVSQRQDLQAFLDEIESYLDDLNGCEFIGEVVPENLVDQIRSSLSAFDTIRSCCNRERMNLEIDK